ncbi:MAG TPA: hypothetical protein VFA52_01995 [Candidatus Paceibacterota bacterium]|nr:hypothetical protein [Candidatus Paceibacterota bacterium]
MNTIAFSIVQMVKEHYVAAPLMILACCVCFIIYTRRRNKEDLNLKILNRSGDESMRTHQAPNQAGKNSQTPGT